MKIVRMVGKSGGDQGCTYPESQSDTPSHNSLVMRYSYSYAYASDILV